jgi:hypothetical protein
MPSKGVVEHATECDPVDRAGLGHMKDSLWSIDLFRCESATLRTHCMYLQDTGESSRNRLSLHHRYMNGTASLKPTIGSFW